MADTPSTDLVIPALAVPHDEFMASVAAPVAQRLQQVEAFEARLHGILQETQAEKANLLRILRAADPERFAPATPARARRSIKGSHSRLSKARIEQVRETIVDYLREHPGEVITQVLISERLGFSHTAITSEAFRVLREDQFLRQAGMDKSRKLYKLTASAETEYGIA